jgi:hypothetical protein
MKKALILIILATQAVYAESRIYPASYNPYSKKKTPYVTTHKGNLKLNRDIKKPTQNKVATLDYSKKVSEIDNSIKETDKLLKEVRNTVLRRPTLKQQLWSVLTRKPVEVIQTLDEIENTDTIQGELK